jgi:hypothetical protein
MKVSLVSDAHIKAELQAIYWNADRAAQQEQEAAVISSDQLLFSHENVKRSWEIGQDVDLVMYTRFLLGEIGQATETRVQRSGNTIMVFADSPELVDSVRQKLSNCEEAFVC